MVWTLMNRAARIDGMSVSKILQLAQAAREMRAAGQPVVDLSAGLPDFDTPVHIRKAAIAAMDRGETRYTALDGTPAMKVAICEKFRRDNGLEFEAAEVMAGAGAKQLLFNAFMATLDHGDEVILPTPCWLSYFDMVRIAGGTPIAVPADLEAGYKITADQLRAAITPRSRWVLLNSPSNPTGAVYSHAELDALLAVVAEHPQLGVIADDVYEHIRFTGQDFATPAALRPDLRDRILTVNAVSKAYAMTGWRLGYCGGPAPLIAAMKIVQSQSTSNPSSISQAAAVEALTGPQDFLEEAQQSYLRRRDTLIAGLRGIEGVECSPPEGAFFVFARVANLLGRKTAEGRVIDSDSALSDYLLQVAQVVTVPGSEFGLAGHLRLSFAVSEPEIIHAIGAMQAAIASLISE